MGFHRLTTPVYPGGLRGGDDYINNAAGPGTPAPADNALGSGTYVGSYFFAFGEQVTAAGVNRGFKALAQNCDFLDDAIVDIEDTLTNVYAQIATLNATDASIFSQIGLLDDIRELTTGGTTLHSSNRDAWITLSPAASFNIQLPDPSTCDGWKVFLVDAKGMLSSTKAVTLVLSGVEQINGVVGNYTMRSTYGVWLLTSDGTNWFIRELTDIETPSPTKTATFTVDSNYRFYPVSTTGGAVTANLPTPASMRGRTLIFKDVAVGGSFGTNALTIARNAAENIEGLAANYVFEASGGRLRLYSDGTDWWIV